MSGPGKAEAFSYRLPGIISRLPLKHGKSRVEEIHFTFIPGLVYRVILTFLKARFPGEEKARPSAPVFLPAGESAGDESVEQRHGRAGSGGKPGAIVASSADVARQGA